MHIILTVLYAPKSVLTMKNFLLAFGLLLLSVTASSQQIAKTLIAANSQLVGFLEYKPTDYNVDLTVKYPLIIFLHGMGERGNGTSQIWSVANNAIPKYINAGHPMRFFWNGKWETFLVLSPQLSTIYFDWVDFYTEEMIKYAKANLRIDTNRIIVTGLSLGGGGTWHYATSSLSNAQQLAAVAPVCGTCSGVTYSNIATANLPLWAFHASNDGTVGAGCTTSQVWGVEIANPAIAPLMTLYSSGGHAIWDRAYDYNYSWQNPNIYEWFLGQNKSLPVNVLPISNAGPNVTISTSNAMVNLSGINSSDADGRIVRYIWQKISGPAAGTINTPVSANGLTSVTGLTVAGTYVYELKVVDERASVATSLVTVTVVNGAVPNIPPITQAGSDIMTVTSTASLNGSNSYDPDGSINSYQWTKISGPAIYTISNASIASPSLSFLMIGDYAFELRSTDNVGASSKDTVYIRSAPSALPVKWLYVTAHKSGEQNKILWSTESQYQNDLFEIERSDDGSNFIKIGEVAGAGTSFIIQNYQFIDNYQGTQKTFYRIHQVSRDKKSSYSSIAVVNPSVTATPSIDHFPNPAQKQVTVVINKPEQGLVIISVYSIDGKLVKQQQAMKEKEMISTTMDVQGLQKGTYLMKISIGNGVPELRKMIKQ